MIKLLMTSGEIPPEGLTLTTRHLTLTTDLDPELSCFFCDEPATLEINSDPFCLSHARGHLEEILFNLLDQEL
jgi:hypothetical protein